MESTSSISLHVGDDTACENYEVRFCCEGCCPYLNISGNPELTDYYENYPGIYELTNETFNDAMVYRLMDGVDDVGNVVCDVGGIGGDGGLGFDLMAVIR